MKMITAVVNHEDARAVSQALVKQKFYVTRMASSEVVPNTAGYGEGSIAMPMEVTVGGATIFVTNVERMEKL